MAPRARVQRSCAGQCRKPTRHDLESAGRPVVLTRTCGHIFAANSAALSWLGSPRKLRLPWAASSNAMNAASRLEFCTKLPWIDYRVMPPPTAADFAKMIRAALGHQLSLGVQLHFFRRPRRRSRAAGRLPRSRPPAAPPARVLVMPLRRVDGRKDPVPLPKKHVSDRLRVDTVKFLADGGLSGATAALSVRYRHSDTKGTLRFDREDLRALCQESHDRGWRIALRHRRRGNRPGSGYL